MSADFLMQFTDNNYNGEKQIRDTLKAKQKFTEDIASETFRKKCEQRLFTQKVMPWSEVKKRAAMTSVWQWHRLDALDILKNELVHKDQWRENGNYVEKPPFPKPQTDVRIQELAARRRHRRGHSQAHAGLMATPSTMRSERRRRQPLPRCRTRSSSRPAS